MFFKHFYDCSSSFFSIPLVYFYFLLLFFRDLFLLLVFRFLMSYECVLVLCFFCSVRSLCSNFLILFYLLWHHPPPTFGLVLLCPSLLWSAFSPLPFEWWYLLPFGSGGAFSSSSFVGWCFLFSPCGSGAAISAGLYCPSPSHLSVRVVVLSSLYPVWVVVLSPLRVAVLSPFHRWGGGAVLLPPPLSGCWCSFPSSSGWCCFLSISLSFSSLPFPLLPPSLTWCNTRCQIRS